MDNSKMIESQNFSANFKTQTIFKERKHPHVDGVWICSIDIGNSGTKVWHPNGYGVFPYYSKKIKNAISSEPLTLEKATARIESASLDQTFGIVDDDTSSESDIVYMDAYGEVWHVGEAAFSDVKSNDAEDDKDRVFLEGKFKTDSFRISCETAMAVCLTPGPFYKPKKNDLLRVITGLPPVMYTDKQIKKIKSVFAGDHDFYVKFGNNPAMHIKYTLQISDVSVTTQPLGAVYSAACDEKGKISEIGKKILKSNTIVSDGGYVTQDDAAIFNGNILKQNSDNDLGMHQVFTNTIERIRKAYGESYTLPMFQKILKNGCFTVFDEDELADEQVEVAPYLEEASTEVFEEVFRKLTTNYNNFKDYSYLILDGGSSAAWESKYREKLCKLKSLTILKGNYNDDIPNTLVNVRGYYMLAYNQTRPVNKK